MSGVNAKAQRHWRYQTLSHSGVDSSDRLTGKTELVPRKHVMLT